MVAPVKARQTRDVINMSRVCLYRGSDSGTLHSGVYLNGICLERKLYGSCLPECPSDEDFDGARLFHKLMRLPRIFNPLSTPPSKAMSGKFAHSSKPKCLNSFRLGSLCAKMKPSSVLTPNPLPHQWNTAVSVCRAPCPAFPAQGRCLFPPSHRRRAFRRTTGS